MIVTGPDHQNSKVKVCSPIQKEVRASSIAVVIVGRNAEMFLPELLESLADQTDQPDEVIYYDDFSLDTSLDILARYRSRISNLKVIPGKKQIGISASRNIANSHAKSEYIAVLDSDDLFLNDAVSKYRQSIETNPDVDLLYADTVVFKDGTAFSWRMRYPEFVRSAHPTWKLMTSPVIPFKHSSLVYRRSAIKSLGGYTEELPQKVDFDLFLRFINSDSVIKKLDSPTSHHRTHAGQISKGRLKGILLYWKIIDFHESRPLRSLAYKIIRALGEVAKFAVGR